MSAVEITVRGSRATLFADPEVRTVVDDLLSAEVPGARFTTAFKVGRWDGMRRLLTPRGTFPSGLVRRIADHVRTLGYAVSIDDPTPPLRPTGESLRGVELHVYQVDAANTAVIERRVLLESPTASGKTEIGAEIVRRIGGRTLWLTHRSELARQTRERLAQRLGLTVGLLQGDDWCVCTITVGMVPSIMRRVKARDRRALDYLAGVEVLVLDEAHHAAAETWQTVVGACRGASWQVGLTATAPERDPLTDLLVEGATGPKRVVAEVAVLAAGGFVAAPEIRLLEPPRGSYPTYAEVREAVLPTWRRDPRPLARMGTRLWDCARRRGIVENTARTRLLAEVVARHCAGLEGRPGGEKFLVLCELREHAAALLAACRNAGVERGWCVTGDDPGRESTLAEFRQCAPPAALVATPWFREGMDVPEVDAGAVAGANLSEIAVVQQFGRMLRRRPDKDAVVVYAFLDGQDPADPKDYLAQHTVAQLAAFQARGWTVRRGCPGAWA